MPRGFRAQDRRAQAKFLLENVAVLSQQRKDPSEGLSELISAIRGDGEVNNPLLIAKLPKDLARAYLGVVRKAYGGKKTLRSCKRLEDGEYLVLVAGNRRLLAIGKMVEDRFRFKSIPVKYYIPSTKKPPLRELLATQIRENTHIRPNTREEAESAVALWRLWGGPEGQISYAALSRKIKGLYSPETISHAVKYHSLPDYIRDAVHCDRISYMVSVELYRLFEAGLEDDKVQMFLDDTIRNGRSAAEVRKRTMGFVKYLKDIKNGQSFLFDVLSETDIVAGMQDRDRKTFVQHYMSVCDLLYRYTSESRRMQYDVVSLFTDQSVATILRKLLPHFEDVAEALTEKKCMSPKENSRIKKVVRTLDNELPGKGCQLHWQKGPECHRHSGPYLFFRFLIHVYLYLPVFIYLS